MRHINVMNNGPIFLHGDCGVLVGGGPPEYIMRSEAELHDMLAGALYAQRIANETVANLRRLVEEVAKQPDEDAVQSSAS